MQAAVRSVLRTASRFACLTRAKHTISFITDVEGNLEYFRRIVAGSPALLFTDQAQTHLDLRPDCSFVFGGDCFDKVRVQKSCRSSLGITFSLPSTSI